MPVEIFSRHKFEKALSFLPLGFKLVGANGQLEYKAPVVSRLTCSKCKKTTYPLVSQPLQTCSECGFVGIVSVNALFPGEVFIKIYSSIDPRTMMSRDTGKDSIRLILVNGKGKYLAKDGVYVTRVKGWEKRLKDKIRTLWRLALSLPRCPECKGRSGIYTCRLGQNKGKRFHKCFHCQKWLGWTKE